MKLKINEAPGVDGIVHKMLIENAYILYEPLFYVFKKSMESGLVPSDWKNANVTAEGR